MASASTTSIVDHKSLAYQFMSIAVKTGQLLEEGTALETETRPEIASSQSLGKEELEREMLSKIKNPDKIVKYLQKVGKNFTEQVELVKFLEKFQENSIEDQIFGHFAESLDETDKLFDPIVHPLFDRIFLIEMDEVRKLFEVAEVKLKAFRADPQTKRNAEEAARAVDDRYTIIANIKTKCCIPGSFEDNEILRIADEQIGAIFVELFPKKTIEKKSTSTNDNPFEDEEEVEIDPMLTSKNPPQVESSEDEKEEDPLQSSNLTTLTKMTEESDSSKTKDPQPTTEPRSVTPYDNPPELTGLEKVTHDLADEISQLEQIAKGQSKPVDQDAIKGLVESRLKLEDLNVLRGLVYQIAKEANPNNPALKEWDFGNKYMGADLDRLYKALAALPKQAQLAI